MDPMDPGQLGDPRFEAPIEPDPDAPAPPADPPPPPPPQAVTDDGRTVQDVQRENVFLRANVDLDSKIGKMMLKSYDGPMTIEAIGAEADELGCLRTGTAAPPSPEAAERAAFSHGAEPSTTLPQKHPHEIARELGTEVLMKGGTTEDAIRAGFQTLVGAAIQGDKRVLVNEPPVH